MKKVWLVLGGLLAVALGALLALRLYVVDTLDGSYDAMARQHAVRAARALPLFLADQARLASQPFFTAPRPDKDAGPFLNARLRWEGRPAPEALLRVPTELEGKLAAWGKDWMGHEADVDFASVDLAWMSELHQFGTWSLLGGAPNPSWTTVPLPDLGVLVRLAKLRMLQGLALGAPEAAGRDVEHLSWLCYRTETQLGGLVAQALLKQDARLRERWVSQGHAAADDWKPLSSAELSAFSNIIASATAFTSPMTPDAEANAALDPKAARVGRCAALTEAAVVLSQVRVSHDSALAHGLDRFQAWLDQPAGCDLKLARALWDAKRAPLTPTQIKVKLAGNADDDTAGALLPTFARGHEGKLILALLRQDEGFQKLLTTDGGAP